MSWQRFKAHELRHAAELVEPTSYSVAGFLKARASGHEDDEDVYLSTNQDRDGWTNHETWLVKLWFDCDRAAQATALSLPKLYSLATGALADQLKELANDMVAKEMRSDGGSLASDLIGSALADVNWQEIARHIDEEARDNG